MAASRVLVLRQMTEKQHEILHETLGDVAEILMGGGANREEVLRLVSQADVLLAGQNFGREIPVEDFPHLAGVKLIQLVSAGTDHVQVAALPPAVSLAGNAGAFAAPMAEHVMAMLLALSKQIVIQDRKLRRGEFDHDTTSRSLSGLTAGIIGFGGIGRATAQLMRAFDIRIQAINTSGRTLEPVEFVGTLGQLEQVLRAADVTVLSLPLTDKTRKLIGGRELKWMKPDGILINVARGALIDQRALYEHALAHPRFLIGLDVWWAEPFRDGRLRTEYPLMELDNVIGSPHNSGNVPGIIDHAVRSAAENIKHFLMGERVVGLVDRS
ncbi:MAG TPA: NAD(P)-dependent oxidoreductase [Chloroflexota bacterium]|nr:NAD(P)-dependent oxidoreductase [Chloroflexota bacterium]